MFTETYATLDDQESIEKSEKSYYFCTTALGLHEQDTHFPLYVHQLLSRGPGMLFAETGIGRAEKRQYRAKALTTRALIVLLVAFAGNIYAQTPKASNDSSAETSKVDQTSHFSLPPVDLKSLPKNLFMDQEHFWTAPLHMSQTQWEWAPAALLVGGLFIKADQSIENHVPTSKSTVSHAVTASNAGVGVLAATGAGLFLLGHIHNDDQKRETGILAGEAAIGALR